MLGNVWLLASYTTILGSGTSNIKSYTLNTRDVLEQGNLSVGFMIHSLTGACPTNPSCALWIERGFYDESVNTLATGPSSTKTYQIPVGTNSIACNNSFTLTLMNWSSSAMAPYTRVCIGLFSGTPTAFFSCWAYTQERFQD